MNKTNRANNQRRTILKSAAVSGGIIGASSLNADKWVKPVIDSVVLPTHASTTDGTGILPGEIGSRYSFIDPAFQPDQTEFGLRLPLAMDRPDSTPSTLAGKLIDLVVPTATAVEISSTARLEIFLQITAEGVFRFVFFMSYQDQDAEETFYIVFYGDSTVELGNNTISVALCNEVFTDFPVVVNSVTATAASITVGIDEGAETFDLLYDQNATAPENLACDIPD